MNKNIAQKIALVDLSETEEKTAIPTKNYLSLVGDLEVDCYLRLGTVKLSLAKLQSLQLGELVQLQEGIDEPIDLMVNNAVIARGELMSHGSCFALRITEVPLT